MKNFISALGAALLGFLPLNAQFLVNPYRFSAGVTYTEKDANTAASASTAELAGTSVNTRNVAGKFTATASYNLAKVDVYLEKVGSPTQDITCEIWSDSGTTPSAKIGTTSAAVAASTVPAAETAISFYPTATIVSGTAYFIVLRSASNDASNYLKWHRVNTTGRIDQTDNPAGGWFNLSTTRYLKFKTYEGS
jgi:hypothetical protein